AHPPCFYTYFPSTAPATPHISTLSLHDALPISLNLFFSKDLGHDRTNDMGLALAWQSRLRLDPLFEPGFEFYSGITDVERPGKRSEEHTSELQSLRHLVCRLLLEKKKITDNT